MKLFSFILEELVDKEKRDKLWNIYLGTSSGLNERMNQADLLRVRHIQRQLATIAKNTRQEDVQNDRIESIMVANPIGLNDESSLSDNPLVDCRLRVRRLSQANLEILEQWQAAVQDLKFKETMPWAVRKLLIRRRLRRQRRSDEYQHSRQRSIP